MSSADLDEFLARVDDVTAPVCGGCGATLDPDGPSLYYCDDECSDRWQALQGEPLVGYREPWQRPGEFPGVGQDGYSTQPAEAPAYRAPLGLLPAWLADDMDRWNRILLARVFVSPTPSGPLTEMEGAWSEIGHTAETFRFNLRGDSEAPAAGWLRLHASDPHPSPPPAGSGWGPVTVHCEARIESPQERALRLRRERNTGPRRQGRAPRHIGLGGVR